MSKIIIDERSVVIGLEVDTKEEAIELLANMLLANGYVKESYCEAVLDREKVFPTGLMTESFGVAIPHADIMHVKESMLAVAVLKKPVKFYMLGDYSQKLDVMLIFMLAMKDGHGQLTLLSNLMSLIQDKSDMDFLKKATEAKQVVDFLNSKLEIKSRTFE